MRARGPGFITVAAFLAAGLLAAARPQGAPAPQAAPAASAQAASAEPAAGPAQPGLSTLSGRPATADTRPATAGPARNPGEATGAADPVRVAVPDAGIAPAGVVPTHLGPGDAPVVPRDPARVGWYRHPARTGEHAPLVLLAHVNYGGRAGAFADLDRVTVGDEVVVTDADGSQHRYRVTALHWQHKVRFAEIAAAVYAPAPGPEIRLITCGGRFDRASGRYDSNLVVFAALVDAPAG